MSLLQPPAPIIAIIYGDGVRITPIIRSIASHLAAEGCRLAGLIQRDVARPGRSRCDMLLDDVATGETISISQDRGEEARGCRLDVDALLNAVDRTRRSLISRPEHAPDVVIVNKFGKAECEGGGCRTLIAEAVERCVPVVVAIPWGNLESWRHFAGDLAIEYDLDSLPIDGPSLCRHLGLEQRTVGGRLRAPLCAPAHA